MLSRYQPATKTITYPCNSWPLIGSAVVRTLAVDEINNTSCFGRASSPDTAAPTFTQHQTSIRQRLPPANLPASRSRCDHGGGHRQHQDQDPPSAGETTEEEECCRGDELTLKYGRCLCVGANSQVSRLPVWLLHARDGDVHLHSAEEQAQTQHGGHHAGVGGSVF